MSVGGNQPLWITPFEPRAVVAGWQIIEAAIRIIATVSDWLGYARRFLYPVAPSIASAYRCDHEDSRRPANPISALPDRSSCSGGTMGFQDDQGPDDRGDSDLCLLTDDKARKGARLSLSGRKSRSEEHTSELKSLMRTSYAVFCLKTNKSTNLL